MVTASLRFAGEQLSIELQVENSEAHQRLSADSETIVKSLRGLGYEIDRVTILQSSVASSASTARGCEPLASRPIPVATSSPSGLRVPTVEVSGWAASNREGTEMTRQNGQKSAGALQDRAGDSLYI